MIERVKFIKVIIIIFLSLFSKVKAQDFAQFFEFPQTINPAFVSNNACSEIFIINRIHNIAPGLNFTKNLIDLNVSVPELTGGFQFKFLVVKSPENIFNSYNLSFSYTYSLRLNRNKTINFAIESEYKAEIFNNSNLIFPGMIDVWGNISSNYSTVIPNYSFKKIYFNAGLLFKVDEYYFGFALKNMYSFYFEEKYKMPIELNIQFQRKNITLSNNLSLNLYSSLFTNLNNQHNFQNGFGLNYSTVQTGIFSIQNIYSKNMTNGIMLFVSFDIKKVKIAYSYEFFYGNLFLNKSSLHELSIKYRIKCQEKNKKHTINCPAYQL